MEKQGGANITEAGEVCESITEEFDLHFNSVTYYMFF